jgi:hypothetical protein
VDIITAEQIVMKLVIGQLCEKLLSDLSFELCREVLATTAHGRSVCVSACILVLLSIFQREKVVQTEIMEENKTYFLYLVHFLFVYVRICKIIKLNKCCAYIS